MKKDFDEVLYAVQYADEAKTKKPDKDVPWMFEEVVVRYLTTGVRWKLRRVGDSPVAASPWLEKCLKGPIKGLPPAYANMKENTLYRSLMAGFPFCDMMFKNGEGTLVCIQVSWKPAPPLSLTSLPHLSPPPLSL